MKIELKEHELERALEVFLQTLYAKPISVLGFDLSGMRSKEGLSATIDVEIDGETNIREPKVDSPNVKPTNTEWRKEREPEIETKADNSLTEEDTQQFAKVLDLLMHNAGNKNADSILDLYEDASDALKQHLDNYGAFKVFKQNHEKMLELLLDGTNTDLDDVIDDITTAEIDQQLKDEQEQNEFETENTAESAEIAEVEETEPTEKPVTNVLGAKLGTKPLTVKQVPSALKKAEDTPVKSVAKPAFKYR